MYENEDSILSRVVSIIIDRIGPQKILLFGSRATGGSGESSDYDIFVLVERCRNPRELEKELYYSFLMERIRVPVDVLVDSVERYERLKDNKYLIYHQVDKFGKTLYER